MPIDGRNDEAFGNLDDPCNDNYNKNDTGALDQQYRSFYGRPLCQLSPYHQSIDVFDPTFSQANTALDWNETTGPYGTIVDRITAEAKDLTPGGAAQNLFAVPYYRDDSCFDDGTGTDPGPRVHLRSGDEPRTAADGTPRTCWHPEDGLPNASDHFFQGSIATHGVHLLFIARVRQRAPDGADRRDRVRAADGDAARPAGRGGRPVLPWAPPHTATRGPGPNGPDEKRRPEAPAAGRGAPGTQATPPPAAAAPGAAPATAGTRQKPQGMRGNRGGKSKRNSAKQHYDVIKFGGRYTFRIRAVDGAGNVGRWTTKRVTALKYIGHKHA